MIKADERSTLVIQVERQVGIQDHILIGTKQDDRVLRDGCVRCCGNDLQAERQALDVSILVRDVGHHMIHLHHSEDRGESDGVNSPLVLNIREIRR